MQRRSPRRAWSISTASDSFGSREAKERWSPRSRLVPQFVLTFPLIGDDASISERHDALCEISHVWLMGHHHDRDAMVAIELFENVHDFDALLRIQISGGLVGE